MSPPIRVIWDYAGVEGYAIVSKDTDFRQGVASRAFTRCVRRPVWSRIGHRIPTSAATAASMAVAPLACSRYLVAVDIEGETDVFVSELLTTRRSVLLVRQ